MLKGFGLSREYPDPLPVRVEDGAIRISLPQPSPDDATLRHAYTVKLTGVE